MDVSAFNTFGIPLSMITQLGLFLVLGMYAVFTAIFYYHWKTYGTDPKITKLTFFLYFSSTIPLLMVMSIMTLLF